MADQKITGLTAYTLAASTDVLPIVDVTNSATKKITTSDLAGDWAVFTGTTVTSTTLVDLAGMSIPLTAGTWVFEMLLSGSSSSTAGAKFGVAYSGTGTSINATFSGQTSTTAFGATARITTLPNTGSTTVGTTSGAQITAWIFGQIVVTTSGNLTAQGLKVTSGTLTINASSWMRVYRIA